MHVLLAIAFLAVAAESAALAAEDLRVLQSAADGIAPDKLLELWLKQELYRQVERRSAAYEQIKTAAQCRAWQEERRAFFLRQIGGLPERTPLNAQIVGALRGRDYRVENILFEARPGFHVCANLYLPASPPPWPAVLVPCGHSDDGKAAGHYQRICVLLARNGMAALCYDPIGQGERYQMLDFEHTHTYFANSGQLRVPHPNVQYTCAIEHTSLGLGSILLGANVAQYRIWDGMRAIDYLQSRPDIRADKIGCTGNSGGGTLTAYLMALDDRIVAAAPASYLTTFRRLIDGIGAQDGEQNIFGQIEFGLDQADYVIMRAPKPTLICSGTRDALFDIRGAWELYREAKRFYVRLGYGEHVGINEPDSPHGFTLQQREGVTRWMHRWLIGGDKPIWEIAPGFEVKSDEELKALSTRDWTQEQLQCTPKGQVLLLPGERSVAQINTEMAGALKTSRAAAWQKLTAAGRRKLVRHVIGAPPLETLPAPQVDMVARIGRADCTLYKLVLAAEPCLRLPALAFVPRHPTGTATLYLNGSSMKDDAGPGGPIDALVRQGRIVLAAELRGIGETETGHGKGDYSRGRFGLDSREIYLAYLLGQSYVGPRVKDVAAWSRFLRNFQPTGTKPAAIDLVAIGEAAIPALHAAALLAGDFRTVTLRQMISSWDEVVRTPASLNQLVNVVHGALKHYDLPHLIELAGTEKVQVIEPADVTGKLKGSL